MVDGDLEVRIGLFCSSSHHGDGDGGQQMKRESGMFSTIQKTGCIWEEQDAVVLVS